MIQETSHLDLSLWKFFSICLISCGTVWNDRASSARVKPGCTLNLFENHNNEKFIESLTSNASSLKKNDKVSSLSCTCQGMITTPTHLCLVLQWVQNDFGPSKLFWSSTNHFGQVLFVLVWAKSFWTGPNYKN